MSRVDILIGRARHLSAQLLETPVLQGVTPAELDLTLTLLLLSSLQTTLAHVTAPPPATRVQLMATLEAFQKELLAMAARATTKEVVH